MARHDWLGNVTCGFQLLFFYFFSGSFEQMVCDGFSASSHVVTVFILESKTQPTAPQKTPRVFGTKDSCLQQFSLVLASALWPLVALQLHIAFTEARLAEMMSPAPSILCPIPTVRRWENPAQSCHFWHFLSPN